MLDRKEKKEEQIKEIAAKLIERESNKSALITLTRVVLDEKSRTGIIYFTVIPKSTVSLEASEASALNFLKRKRADIHDALQEKLSMRPIPFLDVAIDIGEKSRQTIEALLKSEE